MYELIVEKEYDGIRLNKYLQKIFPYAPYGIIFKQLRNKNITVNKKKANANNLLKKNDTIQVYFSDDTFKKFSPQVDINIKFPFSEKVLDENIKGSIVYEDDNIILIDKECGLLSQKSRQDEISINELLQLYSNCQNGAVVNRLDRNTTGILIFGKNYNSCRELSNMIKKRDIEKKYHAIVCGQLETKGEEIIFSGYLTKDERINTVKIYKTKIDNSKEIKMACKSLKYNKEKDLTLVELRLLTGASHQLRAQLSFEGHPILGDKKYSNNKDDISKIFPNYKYCLHSVSIQFGKFNSEDLKYLNDKYFRTKSPEWESII